MNVNDPRRVGTNPVPGNLEDKPFTIDEKAAKTETFANRFFGFFSSIPVLPSLLNFTINALVTTSAKLYSLVHFLIPKREANVSKTHVNPISNQEANVSKTHVNPISNQEANVSKTHVNPISNQEANISKTHVNPISNQEANVSKTHVNPISNQEANISKTHVNPISNQEANVSKTHVNPISNQEANISKTHVNPISNQEANVSKTHVNPISNQEANVSKTHVNPISNQEANVSRTHINIEDIHLISDELEKISVNILSVYNKIQTTPTPMKNFMEQYFSITNLLKDKFKDFETLTMGFDLKPNESYPLALKLRNFSRKIPKLEQPFDIDANDYNIREENFR